MMKAFRIFTIALLLSFALATTGFSAGIVPAATEVTEPTSLDTPASPQEKVGETADPTVPASSVNLKPSRSSLIGMILLGHEPKEWSYGAPVPYMVFNGKLATVAKVMPYEEFSVIFKKVPVMEAFKTEVVVDIGRKAGLDFVLVLVSEHPRVVDHKTAWEYQDTVKIYRMSDGALCFETPVYWRWLLKDVRKNEYNRFIETYAQAVMLAIKPGFTEGI